MKIIQTFWSAGKDLMKESFGWKTPEYNLMSWTMSCYSLRQHFDDVELYTDSIGYKLLIETLGLPYTKVHLVFDDFQCLPQHWALAKIKTYSLQTEPFLHVDGDIFLPNPLPEDVLSAPVITQNEEIVTQYYHNMMDIIFKHFDFSFSKFTEKAIEEGTLDSYNMGFFGGNDLDFIHRYCDEVFRFVKRNQINDPDSENSRIICNIFFEQVMLAAFASSEHQRIAGIHPVPVADNGYTVGEFCNLDAYERMHFLHILGGHKRKQQVLEMMERAMFALYPDQYLKIMSMFTQENIRFANHKKLFVTFPSCLLHSYMDFVWTQINNWQDVPRSDLFSLQKNISRGRNILYMTKEKRMCCKIRCNPYLSIYKLPTDCTEIQLKDFKTYLRYNDTSPLDYVALLPMLQRLGFKEIPMTKFSFEIINVLLEREMYIEELQKYFLNQYQIKSEDDAKAISNMLSRNINSLLLSGAILIIY